MPDDHAECSGCHCLVNPVNVQHVRELLVQSFDVSSKWKIRYFCAKCHVPEEVRIRFVGRSYYPLKIRIMGQGFELVD